MGRLSIEERLEELERVVAKQRERIETGVLRIVNENGTLGVAIDQEGIHVYYPGDDADLDKELGVTITSKGLHIYGRSMVGEYVYGTLQADRLSIFSGERKSASFNVRGVSVDEGGTPT